MLIERKHTADLIPADYNPRKDLKPGDPEYDKLKRSMEQFGYVEPVIWNKVTGRVVGGHQRLKVLMDMGVTEVERVVLLRNVDQEWMDHIDAMEQLQDGIRLRAYAQQDPVVEYRLEGFDMFDSMIAAIRENTAKMILTVRLRKKEAPQREQVAKETKAGTASEEPAKKQPVRKQQKPGRNDPCPCGSGLKYKKCCGRNE